MPTQPTVQGGSSTAKDGTPLNPLAMNLAKALRAHESNNNYNAIGDNGESHGAYQFNKDNFKGWATQYGFDPNDFSPTNQDKVAYSRINALLKQGLAPSEVAAVWNGAHMANGKYVANNPSYVDAIKKKYDEIVGNQQSPSVAQTDQNKPEVLGETTVKSNGSLLNNIGGIAKGAADFVLSPFESLGTRVGQLAAGGTANIEDTLGFKDKAAETRARLTQPQTTLTGGTVTPLKPGLQGAAQIGGDAIQAALMAAGPETGVVGDVLSKAPLLSKIPKTAGVVGRILGNAGLGAGFGAANTLSAGDTSPQDLAQGAKTGAAFGGGLGVLGEVGSGILGAIAGRTPASRLEAQTNRLKTLQKAFADNSTAETNPIKTITELKLPTPTVVDGKVNTEALQNALQAHIDDEEKVGTQLVKSMDTGLTPPPPLAKMREDIIKAIQQNPAIRDAGKLPQAVSQLKRRFASFQQSFGDKPTWEVIDNIRTAMNREYDPAERDVARTIGDVARSYLYNGSGTNAAIKSAMQNEAELIKAANFVEKLHGTTVPGGRLGRYVWDGIGTMVGTTVGSMGGPVGTISGALAGGMAADKAAQIYQKSYFNPLLGSKASALEGLLKSPIMQKGKGLIKAGILRTTTQK